jgi:two-component system C4-dicarboxylate transport response regulator DctD
MDTAEFRLRIIVADDDTAVAQQVVRLLDPAKYDAQFVTSRATWLDIVRRQGFAPGFLLLNAGMGGLEILGALHRLQADIPVVMMCRQPSPSFVVQAFGAGAKDFLDNPVSPEDLACVTDVLERQPRPLATTAGESVYVEELLLAPMCRC